MVYIVTGAPTMKELSTFVENGALGYFDKSGFNLGTILFPE
jgi:hypothetical protein